MKKNLKMRRAVCAFFVLALICLDANSTNWDKPLMSGHAYAAAAREVILYPSEKLSMIVLSEGEAPFLENICEANDNNILTYFSDDEPTLLIEVMELSSDNSEILSSEEYITDKITQIVDKYHDDKTKEESLKISKENDKIVTEELTKAIEARKQYEESLKPVYVDNPDMVIKLTTSELDLLERLVQCEAGGEDMIGKILVANVVINRVNSSKFPNTVEGVINSPKQFSPVSSGIIYNTTASAETKEAVQRALSGEDYSENSYYFISRKYCSASSAAWFDNNLTKTVEHGCHEFFTE
ncbi:MAG: cell wall hydrolase [Lachnospiraceae bacterium]